MDKLFQTRIMLKYDTLANWTTNATSFVPMKGEVCIIEIPSTGTGVPDSNSVAPPQYLMKVGDGTTMFPNLSYTSGLAADVYAWAKKPVWEYDDAFSASSTDGTKYTNYTKLKSAIEALSTNYEYQLTPSGTTLLLQKRVEGSSDNWTTVSTINTDGTYNASTNALATESTVTSAVNALDSTVDVTATTPSSSVVPSTTPSADFKVLTKVDEVDGKLSSTTSAAVNVKKLAATGAATDMTVTSATYGGQSATTNAQTALDNLASAIQSAVSGSVTSIGGKQGIVTLGSGLEAGGTNDNFIKAKLKGGDGTSVRQQTEDYLAFDSAGGITVDHVDIEYTTANSGDLATVGSVTAALGTLDTTAYAQGSIAASSGSTPTTSELKVYGIKEVDGKISHDSGTDTTIMVDGVYNSSTNMIATESTVTDAINALDTPSDVSLWSGASNTPSGSDKYKYSYTIKKVAEENGIVKAGSSNDTTLYLSDAPSASNPIITLNDVAGIAGAMVYKGTVNSNNDLPTASTTGVQPGWTYVVATAGTYDGVACEVGDMIIVKTVVAGTSISFNIVNGENQVTNNNANITAGAAAGSETTIATVDGTDIKARVSVTAGSATIASKAGNVVTIKTGVTQTGTSGTIANASGTDIVLDDVAVTGAANELSVTSGNYGGSSATTNAQTALSNLSTAITGLTDNLTADWALDTNQSVVDITSQKSSNTIEFRGFETSYSAGDLVEPSSATTKVDMQFTATAPVSPSTTYKVEGQIMSVNVNKLYQEVGDTLIFNCGSSVI